jgi:hypothetical protein
MKRNVHNTDGLVRAKWSLRTGPCQRLKGGIEQEEHSFNHRYPTLWFEHWKQYCTDIYTLYRWSMPNGTQKIYTVAPGKRENQEPSVSYWYIVRLTSLLWIMWHFVLFKLVKSFISTPSTARLYSYVNMKIYNLQFTTFVNYFTVLQYWC